jgi:hypothetical protein
MRDKFSTLRKVLLERYADLGLPLKLAGARILGKRAEQLYTFLHSRYKLKWAMSWLPQIAKATKVGAFSQHRWGPALMQATMALDAKLQMMAISSARDEVRHEAINPTKVRPETRVQKILTSR